MPEGPEVRSLVDKLNRNLKNKSIKKINILGGRYMRHKNLKNLEDIKFPLKIKDIKCHGKFIYWSFDSNDIVLFNTLGMSGWWVYEDEKHNNIEFVLDDESIYFNDYRNFGTLSFCNKKNLEKKLNELGPDILDLNYNTSLDLFKKKIEKKRNDTLIGSAMLDQKVAAGCGNYLRAECLYIAKISPFRKIKDLKEDEITRIWDIVRQLGWYYYNEKKGIKLNIINNKYQLSCDKKKSGPSKYKPCKGMFLVYQQDEDPYGNKVFTEKINTRTIHYVKNIQK